MTRRKSLREKLVPTLFLAILIMIGIFAVISQLRLRANIRDNLTRRMESSLEKSNQCLDMVLDKYSTILYDLCTDEEVIDVVEKINRNEDDSDVNGSIIRRELSRVCNRNLGVKGALLKTAGGKIIFYDYLSASSQKSAWTGKIEIPSIEKGNVYGWLKEPVEDKGEKLYIFQIARRLIDYRDIHKEVGTVILCVDGQQLRSSLEMGTENEVYLCQNGVVVSAEDTSDFGKRLDQMSTSGSRVESVRNSVSGWDVVMNQSLASYHRTLWEQTGFQILTAIGIAGVLTCMVHFITRPIIKSVDSVVVAMNAAETGDFTVRVPVDDQMAREIRKIAQGFNEMMEQIDQLLSQVKQAAIEQKNAELSALEAQIDPHFLYNTLATINWKAIENEQYELSEMIGALADILRYAVRNAGAPTTIRQEISWLNQYILLQSARLGKEIKTDIKMSEEAGSCRIHKLLLQPFVENSIKHGFYRKDGECVLTIVMEVVSKQLYIIIEDNGKGIDEEMVRRLNDEKRSPGDHVGIANVRKRLKLYYSEAAGIYFESRVDAYTRVHLFIPVDGEVDHEDSDC